MERPLSPVSGPTPTAPLNFISDQTRHCCGWEHAMPVALSSEAGGNYVDQVRNWGETHLRAPEESAEQQLAPPRRQACNAGTLNTRLNSSLILEPPYGHEKIATKSKKSTTLSGLEKEEVTTTPSSKEQSIASTHEGRKTVPLRILPIGGLNRTDNQELRASASATGVITKSPPKVGFTPLHLLDVENGTSILVTNQKFDNPKHNLEPGQEIAVVVSATTKLPTVQEKALFFQERGPSFKGRIRSGFVREFERRPEFAMMDGARRGVLRRLLLWALDDINAVRMGSQLRLFLPFLTAHESYLLSQVMEALDTCNSKVDLSFVIKIAFQNENISRILAESFGARWSFLWHSYQQVSKNGRLNFARQLSPVGGQSRNLLFPNDPTNSFAANLGSASVGIKSTDSDQFGTLVNRLRYRNNQLLLDQRVPKEASIVRAFVEQPLSTMMNHGVVHTVRQLAKHWHNILYQPSGNFSHHRSEQLDPFEMMRTHIPVVCLVLCSIRGRTRWDATVLSHFIRKCQELKPSFGADGCRYLAREMQDRILGNLTAGVASLYDPLHSWLDAIVKGCDLIEDEAKEVHQKVTSVEVGLRLGHDLISQVSWKIPSAKELKDAILMYIKGKNPGSLANENRIQSAFLLITPHDKHTLIDLVKHGLEKSQPAKLLLDRVKNLVHRDIRREALNEAIRELSLGEYVTSVAHDEWYWLEEGGKKSLYICKGKGNGKDDHRFINVNSGNVRFFSLDDENTRCRVYIPVAESISRAQRCFMNIELEHGKKFSYSAFMDFPFLRIALRRLMVVSQIFCEQLDKARLNVLREVQRSLKTQVEVHDMEVGQTYYTYDCPVGNYTTFHCQRKYSPADPEWNRLARLRILKAPPQSMVVIGGGPIGLITAIHCTENVLLSGGVMQLHEARVALHVTGATYERSEITPLDAKWVRQ